MCCILHMGYLQTIYRYCHPDDLHRIRHSGYLLRLHLRHPTIYPYSTLIQKRQLQYHLEEVEGKPGKYIYIPRIYDGEGRYNRYPFQVLRKFEDKLFYLWAHSPVRVYPPKGRRKWTRYQREYYKVTNYIKKYLPWLEGVKWDKWYAEDKPTSEAHGFDGALKQLNLTWYDYLFDKNLIVICDGDEYHVWKGMKEIGLIDKNGIRKEVRYD